MYLSQQQIIKLQMSFKSDIERILLNLVKLKKAKEKEKKMEEIILEHTENGDPIVPASTAVTIVNTPVEQEKTVRVFQDPADFVPVDEPPQAA